MSSFGWAVNKHFLTGSTSAHPLTPSQLSLDTKTGVHCEPTLQGKDNQISDLIINGWSDRFLSGYRQSSENRNVTLTKRKPVHIETAFEELLIPRAGGVNAAF